MATGPLTLEELYPPHPGEGAGTPEELDAAAREQAYEFYDKLGPGGQSTKVNPADDWAAASGRKPLTIEEVMGQPAAPPAAPLTEDELMGPRPPALEPDVAGELAAQYGPTGPQAQLPPEYSPVFKAAAKARTAKLVELRDQFRALQAARVTPQPIGPPTTDQATGMALEGPDIGSFTQAQAPNPEMDAQKADAAARAATENELVSAEAQARGMDAAQLTGGQRRMLLAGAHTKLRRAGLMVPGTEPEFPGLNRPDNLAALAAPGPGEPDPLLKYTTPDVIAQMPRSEAEGMRARLGMQGPPPVERRVMTPAEDVAYGVAGGVSGITPEAIANARSMVGAQPLQINDPGEAARRNFEMAGAFVPIGGISRMMKGAPSIFRALAMSAPGAVRETLRSGPEAGAQELQTGLLMFGPMEIGGDVARAALGPTASALAQRISVEHPYFASGVAYSPAVIGTSGGILLSPLLQGRDITLDDVAWSLLPVLEAAGTIGAKGARLQDVVDQIKDELRRTYGDTFSGSFGEMGAAYRGKGGQPGPGEGPPPVVTEKLPPPEAPGPQTRPEPPAGPPGAPEPLPPEVAAAPPPTVAGGEYAGPERRSDTETARRVESLSPGEQEAVLGRPGRVGSRPEQPGERMAPGEAPPPPERPSWTQRPNRPGQGTMTDEEFAKANEEFQQGRAAGPEQGGEGGPAEPTLTKPEAPAGPEEAAPYAGRPIYRGYGRAEKGSVYTGAAAPIAGPGRYYAFDRKVAQKYGPNVEESAADLKNPLVITDGDQWKKLTQEAGWPFPNPFGTSEEDAPTKFTKLRDVVVGKGHDGLIVDWDAKSGRDIGPNGENWKLLRRVFDSPQLIDYNEPAAEPTVTKPEAPAGEPTVTYAPSGQASPSPKYGWVDITSEDGTKRAALIPAADVPGEATTVPLSQAPEAVRGQVQGARPKEELMGEAPATKPEAPVSRGPAPVEYKGYQEGIKTKTKEVPAEHYYQLTEDIPGHPKDSTLGATTLRDMGYDVPEPPEFFAAHDKKGWKVTNAAGDEVMRTSDQEGAKALADRMSKKTEAAPTVSKPEASAEEAGKAMSFPTAEINADPARFQYKIVHGPEGETGSLADTKKYNPVLAGAITVWRDPADNKVYVINGHNRHARAVAAGAKNENVIFIDAKNEAEARTTGALQNIAEGRGNALDAAKFFRDSNYTMDELREAGLKMTERVAEDGLSLSRLAPHLFTQVATGELDMRRGVAIGARLDDHELQGKLVELVKKAEARGRKIDTGTIQELADMVAGAPKGETAQASLFGGSTQVSLAIEKASILSELRRRLAREKRLLSTVSKTDAAKILSRAGNIIDPEASSIFGDQAAAVLSVFDKLKNKVGPIGDAINAAAKEVGAGANVKATVEKRYADVVAAIHDALKGGPPPGGPPSGPPGGGGGISPQGAGGAGRPPAKGGPGGEPEGGAGPLISKQRVERPLAGLGKSETTPTLFGTGAKYPILRGPDTIGKLEVHGGGADIVVRAKIQPGAESLSPDDWRELLQRVAKDFPDAQSVKGTPARVSRDMDEYRRQGGLAFARVEREGKTYATAAGGGKRALEIFRQNYRGDAAATTVREAMQNAVDALRARHEQIGAVGSVHVTLDVGAGTITMSDNGIGMTPDVASSALVELGESHKPGTTSSGGFGLAKAAIFGNADKIVVQTVADTPDGKRIETTITGTGEDWMDPHKGLEVVEASSAAPTGTTVVIKLAKTTGGMGYNAQRTIQRIRQFWRLPYDLKVNDNFTYPSDAPTPDSTRPITDLTSLATVKLAGGDAEVLASKQTTESSSLNYHVLNNGLYQFTGTLYLKGQDVEIPAFVVVDVKTTVGPTDAKYPFTLDRDALRTDPLTQVEKYLTSHLVADANRREAEKYRAAFADAPKIIPGLSVVDATGLLGPLAKKIAADQTVRMVAFALSRAFERIRNKVEKSAGIYGQGILAGLGLTNKWYGVSIPHEIVGKVGSKGTNLILLQPFLAASKARVAQFARPEEPGTLFPYSEDEAIEYLAAQMIETMMHELAHQKSRGHEADFANYVHDVHAEVAPIYADVVRQLQTVLRMPGVRSTLETYHDEIAGAIHNSGARDFLSKVGSEHPGPSKPGAGAPGAPGGRGRGPGPQGNLPTGEGPPGAGGQPSAPAGGSPPRKYQPSTASFDEADRKLRDVIQRIGRVADQERGKEPKRGPRPEFAFGRDTLEKEWKAAHGLPAEKRFARAREHAVTIWHKLTRQFHTLPRGAQWEPLRFGLTTFLKRWPIYDRLSRQMEEYIVGPLDRTGLDVFDRKILFESLKESVELHEKAVRATEQTGVPISEAERAPFMTPFGLTKREIDTELARVNAWIAEHGREDVIKALQRRREVWPALREALYQAHKENGHDIGPKLLRDEYARHQVLDKAAANYSAAAGGGGRLKGAERASYLHRRTGTMSALNTDYLQAEFEVMRAILTDIQKERLIGLVDKNYNVIDELKRQAAAMNSGEILRVLEATAPPDLFGEHGVTPRAYAEKVMRAIGTKQAMAFEAFKKAAGEGELPDGPEGEWTDLLDALAESHDSGKDLPDDMYPQLFKYAGWLLKQRTVEGAGPGKMAAATLFRGIAEKRRFIERNLEKARAMGISPKGFVRWRDLIPDSHQELAPRSTLKTFTTYSVPEQISRPLMEGLKEAFELTAKDLRRIRALGGAEDPLVVPNEVADTLNDLGRTTQDGQIAQILGTANNYMKEWFLLSMRRVVKSQVRNLSGDADILFVGNPHAFLQLGRAIPEMWNAVVRGHMPTGDAFEYLTRGGLQSTLQSTELAQIPVSKEFEKFLPSKSVARRAVEMPKSVWQAYWKAARLSADYRESILRYAAFIDYLKQMRANEHGMPDNWGASYAPEVMALTNIYDRAFKLSNELMGAYDSVTHADRYIARQLIPFWRFQAINLRRYPALVRNSATIYDPANRALSMRLGRKAVFTAARSPVLAMRLGWMIFKMAALMAAAMAINLLYKRDEEEDLPPEVRNRMHVVLGRDKEGRVIAFTRLGAAQDFLEWFGADSPWKTAQDVMNGNGKEALKDMAWAPINKLVAGFHPVAKMIAEVPSKKTFFPDVRRPGRVRDVGLYMARQLAMEPEYRKMAGLPMRGGWKDSIADALVYRYDPGESAYYETLDNVYRFKKDVLGRVDEFGGMLDPKSYALYWWRYAVKVGDRTAEEKFRNEYFAAGGTDTGLDKSFDSLNPLSGLHQGKMVKGIYVPGDADLFVDQMTPFERRKYDKAIAYFESLGGVASEEPEEEEAAP